MLRTEYKPVNSELKCNGDFEASLNTYMYVNTDVCEFFCQCYYEEFIVILYQYMFVFTVLLQCWKDKSTLEELW